MALVCAGTIGDTTNKILTHIHCRTLMKQQALCGQRVTYGKCIFGLKNPVTFHLIDQFLCFFHHEKQ
jgi:hypothetical protein